MPRSRKAHRAATPVHAFSTGVSRSASLKATAGIVALLMGVGILPSVLAPAASAAPVGQGLTLNAGDLRFILKQIKIAENHATKEDAAGNPVPGQPLLGTGANQIASPLLPYGLRTVDGSENNLVANQHAYGASNLPFPRLAPAEWRKTPTGQSYGSMNSNLTDADPRFVSNVIVDQTASNPAAIAAAGKAHRTVNDGPTAVPCDADGKPANCVPLGETLDIPNVTTDFGLSPPYNGMFALFGQFFDHGIDSTRKTKNIVMIPLTADDPLMVDGTAARAPFMLMNRAENQPGEDKILGTADDVRDGTNSNSPWVDQSQTYSSHPSHQVFLREYVVDAAGKPASTGRLLEGSPGGMPTWKDIKEQAAKLLGLALSDRDVTGIPMLATDQYGRFLRGPHGLPQYVTEDLKLVEGDLADPVAPPANVQRIGIAFLDDIAHTASPFNSQTGAALTPDADSGITSPTGRQPAGSYDDEMLNAHFVAGDGRVNENIGLTAIHQIFHSEHNRLTSYIQDLLTSLKLDLDQWQLTPGVWNGERIFQAARFVTEMEYQHLVFEEFARKIQPGINAFNPMTQSDTGIDPAIMAEFAHATYRFGHSMLTETVDRRTNAGADIGMPLLEAFLNPPAYFQSKAGTLSPEAAAGTIVMGMTDQVGAELDEFVTDTLRNNVLGLPLDLATLNIARGRDTGIPSLNNFRKQLHRETGESSLKPYGSWVDFGQALKHPDSVVNFLAAYGTHPTITAAKSIDDKRAAAQLLFDMNPENELTPADAFEFANSDGAWKNDGTTSITGLDSVDLWTGGLAESQNLFGGLLGSTFNYIFERQLTDLQDGDRLYYLSRTTGLNLRDQLEGNSFAELIMRNTDAAALKADVFAVADCEFEVGNIVQTSGNNVADDPASACDEAALLLRMADGTIRYRVSNTVDRPGLNAQSTYNGTSGADRIWGGIDNDTFWGNDGDDILEGNDGADTILGGDGNDRMTDSHGDDVLKGGAGNDAIDAGPGLDLIMAGPGNDFTNGGLNGNETLAGEGNDLVIAGDGPDTVFGGTGDDWQEGGNANDLLQGDSGAQFFDDLDRPGHDVLIGDSGEDDYDAEGGDDIMVAGPGIERNHGLYGFDWVTHARSVEAADSDMRMVIVEGPNALRDRFLLVEAMSGWDNDDILRGTDDVPSDRDEEVNVPELNNVLDSEGIARIGGLKELLPEGATSFGAGNILLGGSGSDQIWGNGADDIIDGDKWLNVRLSVRSDPSDPATETRSATSLKELQADILRGAIDPGNIVIVREILDTSAAADVDTAAFSGSREEYTVSTTDGVTTVAHTGDPRGDGTDRLTGIEKLKFSDVTLDLADQDAPVITGRTPAENATGVPVSRSITVTFSENVTGITGSTLTLTALDGTAVPSAVSYDEATRTATLDPDADLEPATAYQVSLSDGIRDEGGNALPAAGWMFTTVHVQPQPPTPTDPQPPTPTDPQPPTDEVAVTERTPAADATGFAVKGNVSAVFNEPVSGVDGSTVSLVAPNGRTVSAAVTYSRSTSTVTLNPKGSLAPNTRYTVRLTTGIRDAEGNRLPAVSWSFTTEAGPSVTTATPSANAKGIAANADVTVVFSKPVSGVSGSTVQLQSPNGRTVSAAVRYDKSTRTATLNPKGNLAVSTRYTVKLKSGIADRAGTRLAATSWSFTTEAGPSVESRTPAPNSSGFARSGDITVRFSEPVTGIGAGSVRLVTSAGKTVSAKVSYNATTQVVTLNPGATLAANSRYSIRLSDSIKDRTGNALKATSWNFTTGR
jgi:Ca2+-binding RTX toxin-like protein